MEKTLDIYIYTCILLCLDLMGIHETCNVGDFTIIGNITKKPYRENVDQPRNVFFHLFFQQTNKHMIMMLFPSRSPSCANAFFVGGKPFEIP
jgi:hypothetical protein